MGKKEKILSLKKYGCAHPEPSKVKDELFLNNDFFDPNDLVQVKYEMIRRKSVDKWTATKACAEFGFSRPSFYEIKTAFEKEGIEGLFPAKRGPKKAHKLKEEVLLFIEKCLRRGASLRPNQISAKVKEKYGIEIHHRSIARAIAGKKKKLHKTSR